MNKNRMILAVSGGVILVAVLAMAFLNWNAYSAKIEALDGNDEEGTLGLASMQDRASSLTHGEIYPCAESERAIAANTEALEDWRVGARKLASRGDRPVTVLSPAQFKADIAADAKRLVALPGAVAGALAKPDFAFGPFKSYLVEGVMPKDAELPELTRRWDDVEHIVELLAQSGIAELVDVSFKVDAATAEAEKAKAAAKEKKPSKKARRNAKKAVEPEAVPPAAFSYVFTFKTRPAGFAKALNALGTDDRFIVVDTFSITRTSDPIGAALGVADKKGAMSSRNANRRARRGQLAKKIEDAGDKEAEAASRIVTDPVLDAPFTVALSVTVYDFRTMEASAEKADAEDQSEEQKETK